MLDKVLCFRFFFGCGDLWVYPLSEIFSNHEIVEVGNALRDVTVERRLLQPVDLLFALGEVVLRDGDHVIWHHGMQ